LNQSCCPAQTTITDEDVVLFLDGHHDLSPDQIATLGTKVAIAARHAGQQPRSGVRVIPEMESPMNLYCLLRTTTAAELVGPAESELFQWAALFNPSATKRRMYSNNASQHRTTPRYARDDPRMLIEYFHPSVAMKNASDEEDVSPGLPITVNAQLALPTANISHVQDKTLFGHMTITAAHLVPLGTKEHPVAIVTHLSGEMWAEMVVGRQLWHL
jgi:hypothetical protein